MDSPSGSAWRLILRARPRIRAGRSRRRQAGRRARSLVQPALLPGQCPRGRQWDLTGCLVTRPAPLPCSQTPAESVVLAIRGLPDTAPALAKAKASATTTSRGSITRLQHTLSTLHDRRRRRPCKTRFRLAGSASTGGDSNPMGHSERFQVIPSSYPGLRLSQCQNLPSAVSPSA
jgi:hypothetical protein